MRVEHERTHIKGYTPLDKVVLSFARKALKAMTGVDLCTYIVMKFSFWSLMPSYSWD